MDDQYLLLVEESARIRGEKSIPRKYILRALEKIQTGEKIVEKYAGGWPSLKGVFDTAKELQEAER